MTPPPRPAEPESPTDADEASDRLAAAILASRKYRTLCPDTVRDVAHAAMARHRRPREAEKAARRTLHGIQAAFVKRPDIAPALEAIRLARQSGDTARVRLTCKSLMRQHASTRERLPLLGIFYERVFALTGVPRTVLDIASGLHPLAIPWMGLPDGARYVALEIAGDLVDDTNAFLQALGFEPLARVQDVVCQPPEDEADLAFLMKAAPCLDRREAGATRRLIDALRTPYVVVTWPLRSLSGRDRGMEVHYENAFRDLVADRPWETERVPVEGELAFVIRKPAML